MARRVKCTCGKEFDSIAEFDDHVVERSDARDHEHEEIYQPKDGD